ncbi:MAG: hypothetical protein GY822_04340 [Deltaproteobacteria bacterium]|nr:hypothetical protein [Deltaproteobacteria bacterium]
MQAIGCERASDEAVLEQLFLAKFSEALKTVGYSMNFESLYKERDAFKDSILREIGTKLNGYIIDDAAIDYLEQTSIEDLDPANTLDTEGIRAITEVTSLKHVETNRLQNEEKKRITKQNVAAREAVLILEQQRASAEAHQAREVANYFDSITESVAVGVCHRRIGFARVLSSVAIGVFYVVIDAVAV